jgi:hypothetical protein
VHSQEKWRVSADLDQGAALSLRFRFYSHGWLSLCDNRGVGLVYGKGAVGWWHGLTYYSLTAVAFQGNAPVIIHKQQLQRIAPLWTTLSLRMKQNSAVNRVRMYGHIPDRTPQYCRRAPNKIRRIWDVMLAAGQVADTCAVPRRLVGYRKCMHFLWHPQLWISSPFATICTWSLWCSLLGTRNSESEPTTPL